VSKARVYARNLAANWIGHGASMVVLFFLSPFVIHMLGNIQYGIWSLLSVLTGYMGILDLGIRSSTGRHVTLYIGKKDHKSVDETIRTSLAFFSAFGILIVAVGLGLGWVFPDAFSSVPVEYHALVRLLLPMLAMNMWLTTFRSVLASVLIAHDRFDLTNGVDLVMLAIRTLGTILALNAGTGLLGLTLVVVGCNVVGMACTWVMARRTYRQLRLWPFVFLKPRMRELLGYGVAAFIAAIATKIVGQTDLIIVGAVIGIDKVTTYSVGAMLIYYSFAFISQIGGTFFPPVQRAVARGEMGEVKWLFHRQVRLALLCGLPAYVGFAVFAEPFIRLWMLGPEFPESSVILASTVMKILAASKILSLLLTGSYGLLSAMGYPQFNALIGVMEAFANLGLTLLFTMVFGWGLAGVAAGTFVARLLVSTVTVPLQACRKSGMRWGHFMYRFGGISIITTIILGGWCIIVRVIIPVETWGTFIGAIVLATAGMLLMVVFLLVQPEDRKRVFDYLGMLMRR